MRRKFIILTILICACGGRPGEGPEDPSSESEARIRLDADTMLPRALVVRAELATEVDKARYRPLFPPATEFRAEEKVIYLVGKLKQVPPDSTIKVKWFLDASPEPLLVSSVQGSDRYQFLASFSPTEKKFIRGTYTARIYVNDQEIGAVPFLVYDEINDIQGPRVRNIEFSSKIRANEKPVKPTSHFSKGTERVFVTFDLKGAEYDEAAEVKWFRGTEVFHSEIINFSGDKRYSANINSFPNLPSGDYKVQICIRDSILGTRGFLVGKKSSGPMIEKIVLGTKLGQDSKPVNSRKWFKTTTTALHCGLDFVDLEPHSLVEIEWAKMEAGERSVLSTQKTIFESGGSGSFGTAWEPEDALDKGKYKLTILINGEIGGERLFEVR